MRTRPFFKKTVNPAGSCMIRAMESFSVRNSLAPTLTSCWPSRQYPSLASKLTPSRVPSTTNVLGHRVTDDELPDVDTGLKVCVDYLSFTLWGQTPSSIQEILVPHLGDEATRGLFDDVSHPTNQDAYLIGKIDHPELRGQPDYDPKAGISVGTMAAHQSTYFPFGRAIWTRSTANSVASNR